MLTQGSPASCKAKLEADNFPPGIPGPEVEPETCPRLQGSSWRGGWHLALETMSQGIVGALCGDPVPPIVRLTNHLASGVQLCSKEAHVVRRLVREDSHALRDDGSPQHEVCVLGRPIAPEASLGLSLSRP